MCIINFTPSAAGGALHECQSHCFQRSAEPGRNPWGSTCGSAAASLPHGASCACALPQLPSSSGRSACDGHSLASAPRVPPGRSQATRRLHTRRCNYPTRTLTGLPVGAVSCGLSQLFFVLLYRFLRIDEKRNAPVYNDPVLKKKTSETLLPYSFL